MKKLFIVLFSVMLIGLIPTTAFTQENLNSPKSQIFNSTMYQYQAPAASLVNCENILCYVDGSATPPPNTFVDQALVRLGCSYTMYYSDYDGFVAALASQTWDIVIFSKITNGNSPDHLDPLNAHVLGGGKLLYNDWAISFYPVHPLWTSLGFTYNSSYDSQFPIYAWEVAHPAFNDPNVVNQLLDPVDDFFQDGHFITALPGFQKLAGFTNPGPDPNQEAILLGNDGRTAFFSFTPTYFRSDDNSNLVPDMVEMYENFIKGSCEGFGPKFEVPISNWAIILGLLLIGTFIVIRFRKIV